MSGNPDDRDCAVKSILRQREIADKGHMTVRSIRVPDINWEAHTSEFFFFKKCQNLSKKNVVLTFYFT